MAIPLVHVQTHWLDWDCPSQGQKAGKRHGNENVCEHPEVTWPDGLGQQEEMLLLKIVCYWKQKNPKGAPQCTVGEVKKLCEDNSELLQEHLKVCISEEKSFWHLEKIHQWLLDAWSCELQPRQPHSPRGRCRQPP